jgi:hypothetical protein
MSDGASSFWDLPVPIEQFLTVPTASPDLPSSIRLSPVPSIQME